MGYSGPGKPASTMLRQRRPPVLCGAVEAPTTAALRGFTKQSSGCLTRSGSSALELRRPLLGERPRSFLGILSFVDEGRHGGVVPERLLRVLVEAPPRHLLRDLDGQRPILADAFGDLRRRREQRGGLHHPAHQPD